MTNLEALKTQLQNIDATKLAELICDKNSILADLSARQRCAIASACKGGKFACLACVMEWLNRERR